MENSVNLYNYCSDDININMKSYILYIHRVLNTSVKVSGGVRHYLPGKVSLELC